MQKKSVTERTFQGELYRIINKLLEHDENIKFSKITQEENVGVVSPKFADGKLYSSVDLSKIVSFELKNTNWDATDEILVKDAAQKANDNGYDYFVTGTPRQLIIYKTFISGIQLNDRKLKIYIISNIKKEDDILLPFYEKQITPKLKEFLSDLSDLLHGVREVHWDSIDKFFVNKLSAYILESSAEMFEQMYEKITISPAFKKELKIYLKNQDIFNVTLNFDSHDIYNLCQLANYLLFLKIMFYSYLQKEVPELNLKSLQIPEDKDLLNKTLRARFDDVLKHDYNSIFESSVLDQFEFSPRYIPVFKKNVEEIKRLDFKELNADIIGTIYNTLIDNQEQHDRGQHFTNINEVDIVNAFCINEKTQFILDSACGAGTFLVRGYYFLKYFQPELSHEKLLERLWGIEIAPFPVLLATMNLCLQNIKLFDNYPVIINNDFSNVRSNTFYHLRFLNVSKTFKIRNLQRKEADVQIPEFDACVGNPPYIRQELIEKKDEWNKLAEIEWGMKKINQKSDLYVYYLMHTAAFLKEGCRLGYVISSSWLDVSFGANFQKFLLDHFKIIAIIDNQKIRSFETASINTVILIIEKCSNKEQREENNVRFVRIYSDYERLIGTSNDINRVEKVITFVNEIENPIKTKKTKDYTIIVKNQKELGKVTTFKEKYENGHWGANYLRSSEIFTDILNKGIDKLIPLQSVADVRMGIITGANEFFYVIDDTEKAKTMSNKKFQLLLGIDKPTYPAFWKKYGWYYSEMNNRHYFLERFYVKPLFKTQKEAKNLDVDLRKLKYGVIICPDTKNKLSKFKNKILKYIEDAEALDIHKRPTNSAREIWYDLTSPIFVGDFIFPAKIGEKYRLIDNRKTMIYCDKVNYVIKVKDKYSEYSDIIFLILNSITFRHFIDLFSRQLTGNQTLSDVDVNVVEKTLIINPELLKEKKKDLLEIYKSLKGREQSGIFHEVKQPDKKKLDMIILTALGLSEKDVDELYRVAAKYVSGRTEKSASVKNSKSKMKINYEDTLKFIQERFPEITKYKELIKDIPVKEYKIPEWKAKYLKNDLGNNNNLFGVYNVYFQQGDQQQKLSFSNPQQIMLFEFLNSTLDIKNINILIPTKSMDNEKILKIIKKEFEIYNISIKNLLKLNRSKANHISIYRELFLS